MTVLTNPKHEQLALLIVRGLSATKAYVQAGYSARGARQSAHSLLNNDDISLCLAALRNENPTRNGRLYRLAAYWRYGNGSEVMQAASVDDPLPGAALKCTSTTPIQSEAAPMRQHIKLKEVPTCAP